MCAGTLCVYMHMYTLLSTLHMYMYVGFTTNGEFNSLRWKGYSRPLTVLQLKREARAKYQSKGLKSLLDMITPIGIIHTLHVQMYMYCIIVLNL